MLLYLINWFRPVHSDVEMHAWTVLESGGTSISDCRFYGVGYEPVDSIEDARDAAASGVPTLPVW